MKLPMHVLGLLSPLALVAACGHDAPDLPAVSSRELSQTAKPSVVAQVPDASAVNVVDAATQQPVELRADAAVVAPAEVIVPRHPDRRALGDSCPACGRG